MLDYAGSIDRFVVSHFQTIASGFLPAFLMAMDAMLKNLSGLRWDTYGADIAFCGLATLSSSVVFSLWPTVSISPAAIFVLIFHGFWWAGILRLATTGWQKLHAILGGLAFFSALQFSMYYLRGS